MADSGYYSGYQDDVDVDEQKRHQALYLIGIILLITVCIIVLWVCIMLACYVPGFLKKTLEAWLNSSSLMKRRVASTLTRTPFEATGPERERNWDARRQSVNTNPVNQPNTGSVF
ncbi:movement protein [Faba bean necrotic yellows virus]|nr:MP [Faba bean necrotic yellows virus]AHC72250.1 movement protein [Faba bean necrotic yellows virus]AHC72258.1 movement protein [Faba bean necrotic yellows virus]ASL05592.1 movement protein [Faba bean necrotic yellows virus]ASL05595.1 movement protein [Faba bean necrotic yellows virus]